MLIIFGAQVFSKRGGLDYYAAIPVD